MKHLVLTYITTLILILADNAVAEGIYKCVDAEGNVSFSQTSCPKKTKGGMIEYSEPSKPNPRGESRYSIMNQDRIIKQDQNLRGIKKRIHGSSSSGYGTYGSYDSYGNYGNYGSSRKTRRNQNYRMIDELERCKKLRSRAVNRHLNYNAKQRAKFEASRTCR